MRPLLLFYILLLAFPLAAQTNIEQALELGRQAIQKMEAGKTQASIKLLEQAEVLDPDNIIYPYEIAYAHYLAKDYPKAIKLLKKLVKHPNVNDLVLQMLGNAYDMNQQPQKAIAAYEEGIQQFPTSGILHLERGTMELKAERYNEALNFYEKGIYVDPTFPSNYYWASRIYLSSSEKIWGFLYGEIFMNMERNTARTASTSKLLYDAYTNSIQITKKNKKETVLNITLCKTMTMTVSDLQKEDGPKLPFCMVYETTLTMGLHPSIERVDLESLSSIRDRQLTIYYKQKHDQEYDNLLFQYQKRLQEEGHYTAYTYWILMKGNEPAFGTWLKAHEAEWEAFIAWFSENPLEVTKENYFHSSQY